MWRTWIVILAAIDGALATSWAGEAFWVDRRTGGETSIGQAFVVDFAFAPLSAVICGCLASVFIYWSGGFSLRGPDGHPPLTKWEKGFAICSAAAIAGVALWILMS